jgi:hypothetical protein
MAKCNDCQQEMTLHVSCVPEPRLLATGVYEPIRWGKEREFRRQKVKGRCGDCGTPVGGVHHPGCDMEECPRCHWQALSCGCQGHASVLLERWAGEEAD